MSTLSRLKTYLAYYGYFQNVEVTGSKPEPTKTFYPKFITCLILPVKKYWPVSCLLSSSNTDISLSILYTVHAGYIFLYVVDEIGKMRTTLQ